MLKKKKKYTGQASQHFEMFKMSFLSCSHPFIYGNIKQHLKLRPLFVFLACILKPQVILFHFIMCSLSNKFPIMAALVIDSSSFRRVFMEVYIGALPGMRRELEWSSDTASYAVIHPCSPAALELNSFKKKMKPYSTSTDCTEYFLCAKP